MDDPFWLRTWTFTKDPKRIDCQSCKHGENHEVFCICRNEKAEIMGDPIYGKPTRLTASCNYAERKE